MERLLPIYWDHGRLRCQPCIPDIRKLTGRARIMTDPAAVLGKQFSLYRFVAELLKSRLSLAGGTRWNRRIMRRRHLS